MDWRMASARPMVLSTAKRLMAPVMSFTVAREFGFVILLRGRVRCYKHLERQLRKRDRRHDQELLAPDQLRHRGDRALNGPV